MTLFSVRLNRNQLLAVAALFVALFLEALPAVAGDQTMQDELIKHVHDNLTRPSFLERDIRMKSVPEDTKLKMINIVLVHLKGRSPRYIENYAGFFQEGLKKYQTGAVQTRAREALDGLHLPTSPANVPGSGGAEAMPRFSIDLVPNLPVGSRFYAMYYVDDIGATEKLEAAENHPVWQAIIAVLDIEPPKSFTREVQAVNLVREAYMKARFKYFADSNPPFPAIIRLWEASECLGQYKKDLFRLSMERLQKKDDLWGLISTQLPSGYYPEKWLATILNASNGFGEQERETPLGIVIRLIEFLDNLNNPRELDNIANQLAVKLLNEIAEIPRKTLPPEAKREAYHLLYGLFQIGEMRLMTDYKTWDDNTLQIVAKACRASPQKLSEIRSVVLRSKSKVQPFLSSNSRSCQQRAAFLMGFDPDTFATVVTTGDADLIEQAAQGYVAARRSRLQEPAESLPEEYLPNAAAIRTVLNSVADLKVNSEAKNAAALAAAEAFGRSSAGSARDASPTCKEAVGKVKKTRTRKP